MRLTEEDVAKAAGVSVSEVRNVQRIWDAAIQLGYVSSTNGVLPHTREGELRLKFLIPRGPSEFLNQIENAVVGLQYSGPWKGPIGSCDRIAEIDRIEAAKTIVDAAEGADGLAIIAHDDPAIREAVNLVVRKGVPVVTLFSDIQNCDRLAHIGIDDWAAGRAAALLLGRFVRRIKGKVGIVAATRTYRAVVERIGGFSNVLAQDFPQLSIADVRESYGEDDHSYEHTMDMLKRHKDLVGLYKIGGGRQGVARALQDAGRGHDVVLIMHELTDKIRPYVLDGTVDAVIDQDAKRGIDIATRWLLDHKIARPRSGYLTRPMQFSVYFRENLP